MVNFNELPYNEDILNSFIVTASKLNNPQYKRIMCSISGGSDSDILLDLLTRLDQDKKVQYVWFDTGLEYQATKDHLKYLEQKYGIEIERIRAKKSIPLACKQRGQPFLSKQVSENIYRLQKYQFKWEDKPFKELYKEYPKCKAALMWWCNEWGDTKGKKKSKFNIAYNRYLKEFIIAHPPDFKISKKCCDVAKKHPAKAYKKANQINLSIVGVRKSEGGTRSTAHKNCFTPGEVDEYRPLFWYKEKTKRTYEKHFDIVHSACYTHYGLSRTGCIGCPYGRDFEEELKVIETYEPKLYKAITTIFKDSYEYTRKYRQFCEMQNKKE